MDIVERLRGASIYKPHEAENLCEKAADEIERLREQVEFERASLRSALEELKVVDKQIEWLRSEFRELHRDVSMFMDNGPLKQDLLETIADVLGEEK